MRIYSENNELLLISIKPQFAKKIFSGEKTVELRKSAPKKIKEGAYLLIYVTSPVKELWGICRIDNIIKDNPKVLWEKIGGKSGISKDEFFSYYNETKNAYGLEISDVKHFYKNAVKLDCLKKMLPGFSPPQTYRYIKQDIIFNSRLAEIIN